jgi:hypothetical protein
MNQISRQSLCVLNKQEVSCAHLLCHSAQVWLSCMSTGQRSYGGNALTGIPYFVLQVQDSCFKFTHRTINPLKTRTEQHELFSVGSSPHPVKQSLVYVLT